MNDYPGFISSCARTLERNSSSELFYLLTEILNCNNVSVLPVNRISGLTLATFDNDPIEVLTRIEEEIKRDKAVLQYTLKIVPIQYRVASSLENYESIAKVFAEKINEQETWKINLRRRHSQLEREEIISAIASKINIGKVMLENPLHYIIVEVIGKWTYLALSPLHELAISKLYENVIEDNFTF